MNVETEITPVLRLLLGDDDPDGVYDYTREQLESAVQAVLILEQRFASVVWTPRSGETAPTVLPAPEGTELARLTLGAALLRKGGEDSSYSVKTRAMTFTQRAEGAKQLIAMLKQRLYQIDSQDADGWVSNQDYVAWLANEASGLRSSTADTLHRGGMPTA